MPAADSFKEKVAARIAVRQLEIAKAVARKLSPAPRTANATEREMLALWNQRGPLFDDPAADVVRAELLRQEFATGGVPAGEVEDKLIDAMYPERRRMTAHGRPTPSEQVKFANRMNLANMQQGPDQTRESTDAGFGVDQEAGGAGY